MGEPDDDLDEDEETNPPIGALGQCERRIGAGDHEQDGDLIDATEELVPRAEPDCVVERGVCQHRYQANQIECSAGNQKRVVALDGERQQHRRCHQSTADADHMNGVIGNQLAAAIVGGAGAPWVA